MGLLKIVIGVFGGFDFIYVLFVVVKVMDQMGWLCIDIFVFIMLGFVIIDYIKNNVLDMCCVFGILCEVLDIWLVVIQMFKGMSYFVGDGVEVYDVIFENVQVGLCYDYFFWIVNQCGGIVLGIGDLLELVLGWCIFGVGDQMSYYGVNIGVFKIFIQYFIWWCILLGQFNEVINVVFELVLGIEIFFEFVFVCFGEKIQFI